MKTTFYLNGTKVTRKAASESVGKDRLARILEEAKTDFFDDPQTQLDYMTKNGILTIEFSMS